MERDEVVWHPEVLSPDSHRTLKELGVYPFLSQFYLAGGTALALQWGHRTSHDLDFFTTDSFREDALLGSIQDLGGVKLIARDFETLHLHIGAAKVSFLGYHYPVLFPAKAFEGVNVADARDVAAMKLTAIASRGTKRDFIDLYFLSKRYGFKELLQVLEKKFSTTQYNVVHILKSLTYFVDADPEPMPDMLEVLSWDSVKQFFTNEARRLGKLL